MRGHFITFEGGEGSGKSTHAATLAQHLKSIGIDIVLPREPGGSPGAEIIRQTDGRVTHFVTSMGTSGTFTGTSRRLKRVVPGV